MNRTMIFVVIALAGCEGDLSHPDFSDAGTVSAVPGGGNSWKHAGADALVQRDAGGKPDLQSAVDAAGERVSDGTTVQSADSSNQEADSGSSTPDAHAQAADGAVAAPTDSSAVSSDEGSVTDDGGKPCICKCKGKGNCCGCKCKKKSPICPTCKSHSYNK